MILVARCWQWGLNKQSDRSFEEKGDRFVIAEGRRKKEEGRRKKEEGRRKKEEGAIMK